MPGLTGMLRPSTPRAARASRFGVLGGFEFGQPARLHRQAAKPVGDQHHDFRITRLLQFAGQVVHVHCSVCPRLI